MTMVIGLTGGIASGKSTVSNMIREQQIPIVDADLISRQVVEVGKPAYHQIQEAFGSSILNEDETINREKLGSIIFQDEKKRYLLNSIVHPAVRKEMLQQTGMAKRNKERAVVLDIPLLFESKLTQMVEKTLLIYVDENTQLERLMNRNSYLKEEALSRIQSQMPLKEKVELADEVINNNGTINETRQQLNRILEKWL
ncbi:dephospho-CoA kinase [Metabacillus herbersteinensis]|uniref:Dephospho-CoA kinase n=1 Tax=Metabacillus herbersteinensis TaxID=283816 RepID=A0ABV6G9A5_9BACI